MPDQNTEVNLDLRDDARDAGPRSPLPRYLTIEEFSHLSTLSIPTLRRLVKKGALPVIQPGGPRTRMLFRADALEQPTHAPTDPRSGNDSAAEEPVKNKLPGPKPQWQRRS
jgi:excisionase family DNA binding protein